MASRLEDAGAPVFLGGMARGLLGADSSVQCRHARGKEMVLTGLKISAQKVLPCKLIKPRFIFSQTFFRLQTLNMILINFLIP